VVNSYDKCAFVGTDAKEAGVLQGEMIGEYVAKNFEKLDINGNGEISYILFKGEEGNNEAIFRTKYSVEDANEILAREGLNPLAFYDKGNPNKYLVDRNGLWSAAAANEYMTTALTSYSESRKNMIELVICNNDGMAEGAISALNSAGYNLGSGSSRQIPVFGIDATAAAVDLIKKGKMTGTIKQDAAGMAKAVTKIVKNGLDEGKKLNADMEEYNVDEKVFKVRIAYSKYLG
jgi:methyl-galactoside transport system substrate-binding protein